MGTSEVSSWGFAIPFIYCFLTSACMINVALKVVPRKPVYQKESESESENNFI
jgi:hypothetical protein